MNLPSSIPAPSDTARDPQGLLAADLVSAALAGDVRWLESLLARGADATRDESQALRCASAFGHAECVKLLIPRSDPLAMESLPLQTAAHHGQRACLELLTPFMCSESRAEAIFSAARNGHGACVALLLADGGVDEACISKTLSISLDNGHEGIVALLFERDPPMIGRLCLSSLAEKAQRDGHALLACFLRSIFERAMLIGDVSTAPAVKNRQAL